MNCLKCGRTVPEQTLLCPDCLKARTYVARAPEPTPEQSREQRIAQLIKSRRRARRWLALFLVLALAASGLLTAGWCYTRRLNERLTAQNSRINSLETVISEQQSEMEAMEKQYATQTAAVEVYKKLTGLTPEQALEPPQQNTGRRP